MNAHPVDIKDRLDILDLLYRYAHYVDNGLGEAWASTFTSNGRLEYFDDVVEGHDALAAFASRAHDFYPTHFVGNTLMVETAPGHIHARSMVIVTVRSKKDSPVDILGVPVNSPTELLGIGVYDDQIVKTEEGWRFKLRKAGSTGVAPVHPDFLPAALV